jgi:hypothetical protein
MGTINSSDRIAATLYSLGTWFVSRICSIKTKSIVFVVKELGYFFVL